MSSVSASEALYIVKTIRTHDKATSCHLRLLKLYCKLQSEKILLSPVLGLDTVKKGRILQLIHLFAQFDTLFYLVVPYAVMRVSIGLFMLPKVTAFLSLKLSNVGRQQDK